MQVELSQLRRLALVVTLGLLVPQPVAAQAGGPGAASSSDTDRHIVVSVDDRQLWLLSGSDTLFQARVAVGADVEVTYEGKTYRWNTPRGERRVLARREAPVWTVPDWHYYERAVNEGLDLVELWRGESYELHDGTRLEVRGDQVGRIDEEGTFWAVEPGREIVIGGTLYMPPAGTAQRRVPGALGPFALDLGDGYLIHGTHEYNRNSIGRAVSHGCIRMHNRDVERLYAMTPVGTPVFIR